MLDLVIIGAYMWTCGWGLVMRRIWRVRINRDLGAKDPPNPGEEIRR